ncbi:MAG TPA: molybdate ABC transporter substrate-binding protein [Nocardioidaceae bacterium]|nr:molybdate ABC transporter substrate-binding protein [Nocardioidaceae bacterium]
MRRVTSTLSVVLLLAGLLAGCASSGGSGSGGAGPLTVLAASSLTEAFGRLGRTFEKQHPGVHVRFSFDSSATLAEQVAQGAPADVLATADTRTMHTVVAAQANDGKPLLFATNTLVLAVPKDNPAHVTGIADLDQPGVKYLACVSSAPCGALSDTLLKANHVSAPPVSREVDVKSVLSKLELGEADAGLVYATDVRSSQGKVTALQIPHAAQHLNEYPIVALTGSGHPTLARDWVELMRSPAGQQALRAAGFGAP